MTAENKVDTRRAEAAARVAEIVRDYVPFEDSHRYPAMSDLRLLLPEIEALADARRAAPAAGVDLGAVEKLARQMYAARPRMVWSPSKRAMSWDEVASDVHREFLTDAETAVRALMTPAGDVAPLVAAPLTADFVNAFPDGTRDESRYDEVEDALDRAEAESCGEGGRWLKLPERIAALAADRDEARARLSARDRGPAERRAGEVTDELRPGLRAAVEIANQAYREMANTSGAWDEGMRDMAVRISHRISARIAAEDRARGAEGGEASE